MSKILGVIIFAILLAAATAYSIQCPSKDPVGYTVLIPHPFNCSLFYACSNGNPELLSCPPGLLFNNKVKVCDWPKNVQCRRKQCPAIDPLDRSVFLIHETDCTKYYICSNGVPYLQSCPSGLYFNQVLDVCDWPQNVNRRCKEGRYLEGSSDVNEDVAEA